MLPAPLPLPLGCCPTTDAMPLKRASKSLVGLYWMICPWLEVVVSASSDSSPPAPPAPRARRFLRAPRPGGL